MSLYFDIELNCENKDTFKEISIKIKPEWENKEIELKSVQGGITNSLYACYLKELGFNNNETILFRIYGEETDKFISRSEEIQTMCKMSQLGIGSKFYARFKNGICYEFLPGEILNHSMVYDENLYPRIAKSIARLHTIDFNGFLTQENLPSDKEIFIFSLTSKICDLINPNYESYISKDLIEKIPSKEELRKEVDFIETYLNGYTKKHQSLIVFSHNDLNPGNIIYNPNEEKEIKFIDYDYSSLDYQAFDIANHFVEYCGIESDYSDYPSEEYQLKWLTIYLNEFYRLINQINKDDLDKHLVLTQEKLLQFYEEVNLFTLTSHLIAVVWCVVQKEVSKIEFDYLGLLHRRLEQYNAIKKRLIKDL